MVAPTLIDEEHKHFEEIEAFLVNEVKIPSSWIHEARACRALYDRVPEVALPHLLASAQWAKAHEILITELAPHWLLKQMSTKLLPVLLELEKRLPPDWYIHTTP
jgi:mevalonate kinase